MDQTTEDRMLEAYFGLAGLRPEEMDLQRKQAMIDQLRQQGQQMPDMRRAGNVTVAAHPLEFIGKGFQQYQAGQQQTGQDKLLKEHMAERLRIIKESQAKKQPGTAQSWGGGMDTSRYSNPDGTVGSW